MYIGDSPLKIGKNLVERGVEFFSEKNRVKSGISDRQLNSDSDLVCFILQLLG